MSRTPRGSEFRVAGTEPSFFVTKREKEAKEQKKWKTKDIPALVIPMPHEVEKLSKTPRGELLTLPSLTPSQLNSARSRGTFAIEDRAVSSARVTMSARSGAGSSAVQLLDADKPSNRPRKAGPPLKLPVLTFAEKAKQPPSSETAKAALFLTDYDGGNAAVDAECDGPAKARAVKLLDEFDRMRDAEFELSSRGEAIEQKAVVNVTTIDEEASIRVLKSMFQLGLMRNSQVIDRLRQMDGPYLHKRIVQELAHRKQLSRDEFHVLLSRVLKDDYLNRRDCNTLFSVFDSDRSGLVDASEFLAGLLALIETGTDDIAFKFVNTLLEGREKATINAFISRFELDILLDSAQRHYANDPEVVQVLGQLPSLFNFSHHLGRIPVVQLRQRIMENDDYRVIFENLPNPNRQSTEEANAIQAAVVADSARRGMTEHEWLVANTQVADQYMSPDWNRQLAAPEFDSPRWWTENGTVFRATDSNPYREPVFLKERER